jgi:hypothetical protein
MSISFLAGSDKFTTAVYSPVSVFTLIKAVSNDTEGIEFLPSSTLSQDAIDSTNATIRIVDFKNFVVKFFIILYL